MPTRIDPAIVDEWKTYWEERRMKEGVTLNRVSTELAAQYGVAIPTVRCHLDPRFAEICRIASRECQRRRYHKKKRERDWMRNYCRIRRPRSQERILEQVFRESGRDSLTLEEITNAVRVINGIQHKSSTIETRLLKGYQAGRLENRIRGPPLEEVEPGIWKYRSS